MATSLGELAAQFGSDLIGDPSTKVSRVATLRNATAESISFLANPAFREDLKSTAAAAVIVTAKDAEICPVDALVSDDPYLLYARVAAVLHPEVEQHAGIHASAVVHESASVAASAHIAAAVVVGEDCIIGERVFIGPGSVLGARCKVGDGTRLTANVTLVQDVSLGRRCAVHPGAVIGSRGFGNSMSPDGWVAIPQIGGVRIGDDVEVGSNTTIDRGAIDDTVIDNGVRLDNLIQIAHNVHIGEHTAIAAMVGISGSATIGKRCLFAGRSGTVGHVTLCDGVIVGADSVVTKDIHEPGVYSALFPAESDKTWKRNVARFRRSDELTKRVQELEKNER